MIYILLENRHLMLSIYFYNLAKMDSIYSIKIELEVKVIFSLEYENNKK